MHDTASDPQPVNGLASDSASPLDPGPVSTDESATRSQSFQQLPKPVASQPPPVLAGLDASDPCRMLVPFLNALSELEGPRHAARAAADPAWTGAYAEALKEVIGGINGECLRQSCIFLFYFFYICIRNLCSAPTGGPTESEPFTFNSAGVCMFTAVCFHRSGHLCIGIHCNTLSSRSTTLSEAALVKGCRG